MLNPGSLIQNYKVISSLGKGGMGEVYKCEDQMLGRIVAIKELNSALTTDSSFVQRFRQEAQLQARLSHPHIVSLHTFFETFGQYYMVMEFAQGKTLKDLIRGTGPIPEARAKLILLQILGALEYAHSKNIIHRDIKPVNIMISSDDEVKILDFGIARILGEKGLTQTGQQLGTVTYMSPEQVKALKDIDARSDIYSLGVTFFEMLSGRLPYDTNTDSDYEIMNQIVQSALPDPRSYYPHIRENTVSILKKMLEKDRDKRFMRALDVKSALEKGYIMDAGQNQLKAASPMNNSPQFREQVQRRVEPNPVIQQVPIEVIPTYMTQAILVTIFCCMPFGAFAIVHAAKVTSLLNVSRIEEARENSRKAKLWVNWSVAVGLIIFIVYYFLAVVFAQDY